MSPVTIVANDTKADLAEVRLAALIRASVLVPLAVALVVGAWQITVPSFWRDESVSGMAATMPLNDLWHLLNIADRVHALYYMLLRPFAAVSTSEFALRLPSLLATAAAAYGIAVLGRRLAGPWVGMMAGLCYAVLPMVSRYAQEARSYALVTAVAVLASWALVEMLDRPKRWPLYAASLTVLGWLHLYALLLVPAHAVTVLVGRRLRIHVVLALVVAGLALAPLAMLASGQREIQLFWLRPPALADLPALATEIAGWAALPLLALAVLGAFSGGPLTRLALPWAVLPLCSMAISLVYPIYTPRYVLFAIPGLALLAGQGINRLAALVRADWPRWVVVALMAGLTVPAQLAIREPDSRPDDLRAMAAALQAQERPGDAVLYVHERWRLFVAIYGEPYAKLDDLTYAPGNAEPRTAAQFTQAAETADRIWVVSGGRTRLRNKIGTERDDRYRALRTNKDFALTSTEPFGYCWIMLFTRRQT